MKYFAAVLLGFFAMIVTIAPSVAAPVSISGNACPDGWSFVIPGSGQTPYSSNTLQGVSVAETDLTLHIVNGITAPMLSGNQNGTNGWMLVLAAPQADGPGITAAVNAHKLIHFELSFEPFAGGGSIHTITRFVIHNTTGNC